MRIELVSIKCSGCDSKLANVIDGKLWCWKCGDYIDFKCKSCRGKEWKERVGSVICNSCGVRG